MIGFWLFIGYCDLDIMSTVLHLICVGESSWTRFGRLEGIRDISLSEKGRAQMHEVALQLKDVPLREIHYARTTRGNQAAKLIHDELCRNEPFMQDLKRKQRVRPGKVELGKERGHYFSLTKRNQFAQIKLYRDERLNDLNYGKLQGLYPEEVDVRYGELWAQFWNNPLDLAFPDGDSISAVIDRLRTFLVEQYTSELFDVHVGVITHQPVVQMLTCLVTGRDLATFHDVPCTDGSLSVVQYG